MLESAFFQDLAMQMFVAGAAAVLFTRLGWPKVLGYILAGILMNGYTWGGCFLKDVGSVKIIGQLGVVFLMFGMGLSFSAKDMKKIRSVALPAAILDTLVAVLAGIMIFPIVFSYGMTPEAGPKLIFEVLPSIFQQMPGGYVLSILFFFLLFPLFFLLLLKL